MLTKGWSLMPLKVQSHVFLNSVAEAAVFTVRKTPELRFTGSEISDIIASLKPSLYKIGLNYALLTGFYNGLL